MSHKYSSVQIDLPKPIENAVKKAQQKFPGARSLPNPHITVRYGLDGEPDHLWNLLLGIDFQIIQPSLNEVLIGNVDLFRISGEDGSDDPMDVVKLNVNSPSLNRINQLLKQNLPCVDTHPDFMPHITLAYLNPGEGAYWRGFPLRDITGKSFSYSYLDFSDTEGNKRRMFF